MAGYLLDRPCTLVKKGWEINNTLHAIFSKCLVNYLLEKIIRVHSHALIKKQNFFLTYCVPSTVMGTGGTEKNKIDPLLSESNYQI